MSFEKIVVKKHTPKNGFKSWFDLRGEFFDLEAVDFVAKDRNYHLVYLDENGNEKTLLRLCKNVLSKEQTSQTWEGLYHMAKSQRSNQRGIAAGKIDVEAIIKRSPNFKPTKTTEFRVFGTKKDGTPSTYSISNQVHSNVIGYRDLKQSERSKSERCRLTAFSAKKPHLYKKTIPLLQEIDNVFREFEPERHQKQFERAVRSDARIADTAFSTTTVNYGFRTAMHKDKGDYEQGFGILVVMHKPKEPEFGGELILPEFRVAVALGSQDVLLFDTHQYHCNAPLATDIERLSLVCYLREKIADVCPNSSELSVDKESQKRRKNADNSSSIVRKNNGYNKRRRCRLD